jgi:hypothetical protein
VLDFTAASIIATNLREEDSPERLAGLIERILDPVGKDVPLARES